ncbi:hypothetical protein [Methanobrevibacter sp.]|uniref:hypothetical protein n=1 Tax=Methanobrevibacter sp. TaxID=66852 RepID=UPI002E7848EE|nr:hypothetical protein [Methanobrevibacter sp.]MEE0025307.1 hypothetical protein [Methanobrevibacter sp.]
MDELVHSGVKEIALDSDIVLDDDEESQYLNGIKLDVDDLVVVLNLPILTSLNKVKVKSHQT